MNKFFPVLVVLVLCSCKAYKQDIMFQYDDNFTEADLTPVKNELDKNYILKPSDILFLDVFTNDGELIVDPNNELRMGRGGGQGGGGGNFNQQQGQGRGRFQYVIQADSTVVFPLIGNINLVGMTLFEAELAVAEQFAEFYEDPFVKLTINNRRVFVLGSNGGRVIQLNNENTSIFEIIALTGGLNQGDKAQNIRVIRDEQVFLVDLSTVTSAMQTQMKVVPGDVIYIEPWRRPWQLTLRDISPVFGFFSSAIAFYFLIRSL